jgi:hypothetical protein
MQCTKGLNNGQWKSDLFAVDFLWKGIRIENQIPTLSFGKGGTPVRRSRSGLIQGRNETAAT